MAGALVSAQEIEPYWRPLTEAEQGVADALIAVASAMIRARIPDIDTRVCEGTVDPDVLGYVITQMVKSSIESGNRPVDAKSVSDTVGPYAHAVSYADASSQIVFTDDLAVMLGAAIAVTVGSARLGLPDRYRHHHHRDEYLRRFPHGN